MTNHRRDIKDACARPDAKTSNALWLHKEAVPSLVPLLRVYEGCARAYIGAMDDMNIVKLHRYSGKLSYMSCDSFDDDALQNLTLLIVRREPLATMFLATVLQRANRGFDVSFDGDDSQ
ncbi:hypothetical protein Poly21_20190 [Allorhodopirellula heiligendammensis]|uniref:Uncharacterized protein n=1 Tax=Allorhodopirellula heiligendammensis TaxID=2714739 RepID=A0A5C6C8U3_9BACT|nr:hypothetical protein Poly21_20190 [Allorhodopirellula heiligendammensis]